MITISLQGIRFFARHGLYPEELNAGNEFEVNLSVSYLPGADTTESEAPLLNYADLYEMVKKRMQEPAALLESIVMDIVRQALADFPFVKKIDVSVTKLNPPIAGFKGNVSVRFQQEY